MSKLQIYILLFFLFAIPQILFSQNTKEKLLLGVAYYDEYMPYDRLEKDVAMMKEAGINVVRIAESTWGTVEPQEAALGKSIYNETISVAIRNRKIK